MSVSVNLSGQYYGLQITAVDSSTDKTVGTFRIPSGAGTHKKYRLLKCQNSRDSVRHASEKIQKNDVSRFYWTGECTKDVKYIVYIANNGDTDQMNWDILELNCPLEETTSLWAKLDEQPILKSARISQKSPRRYQPRAKVPIILFIVLDKQCSIQVSGAAWSHWAEWGQCLGICGQKNTRSRSRECINAGRKVPVQNCYIDGKGHQIDMEDCTRSCPGNNQYFNIFYPFILQSGAAGDNGQAVLKHVILDTKLDIVIVYLEQRQRNVTEIANLKKHVTHKLVIRRTNAKITTAFAKTGSKHFNHDTS